MLKVLVKIVFTVIVFLLIFKTSAQDSFSLLGRITDSDTGDPVAYAAVCLKSTGRGSISNYDGIFRMRLINMYDTLVISHLSYSEFSIPVSELSGDSMNLIKLKRNSFSLTEIIVTPKNPENLILMAISRIAENYPDYPMSLTYYFSEKIHEDDSVIQHLEATIECYKASYNNDKDKDRIMFTEGFIHQDVAASLLWEYIYFVNGPYEVLFADIAKYPEDFLQVPALESNFLDEKYFKHYVYNLLDNQNNDNWVIEFSPNPDTRKGIFKGIINIEKASYAIVSVKFSYADSRIKRVNYFPSNTEIQLSKNGIFIPDVSYEFEADFIKFKDKWIFQKAVSEYAFEFGIGKVENPPVITVRDELWLTDIKTKDVEEISWFKQIIKGAKLVDQIPNTDSTFWQNYDFKPIK